MSHLRTNIAVIIFTAFALTIHHHAQAQGPVSSVITYQGELRDTAGPANGLFDMEFHLYDTDMGGVDLAPEAVLDNVQVSNGVFSVNLDFGDGPFHGSALWLEIRVRRDGAAGMTILEPRQPISPVPYALQALMVDSNSVSSFNIVDNSVTASDLATNAVTASEIAADAVGRAELADGAVDAEAVGLPLNLRAANSGAEDLLQSGIISAVNSAPSTPIDTWSPYGVIGSVEYSSGTPSPSYLPPAGVLGQADTPSGTGIGVIGMSGVYNNEGWPSTAGVYGLSASSSGVVGWSVDSQGVSGRSTNGVAISGVSVNSLGGDFSGASGVRAQARANNEYGAEFSSDQFRGMFAQSDSNFFDGYFGAGAGVSASSVVDRGAATKILAVNLGHTPIGHGDLVSLAGTAVNPETGKPVLGVALLDDSNSHGVIGVFDGAVVLSQEKRQSGRMRYDFAPTEGAAEEQEYLTIITAGLAAEVNVAGMEKRDVPSIGEKVSINGAGQGQKYAGKSDEVVIGKVVGAINLETLTMPIYIDID